MNSSNELQIDNYLRTLREQLTGMSVADREEIVREISVHIRESAEEPNSSIDDILARLGSPEDLAALYRKERLLERARKSFSPVLMLRATLHLAKRGIQGLVLFMLTLTGYVGGFAFVITGILKPIFPRQIGLWVGPGTFDFGFHIPTPFDPIHEVLGDWYMPVVFALGGLLLWGTTYAVRWCLRKWRFQPATAPKTGLGVHANVGLLN